MKSHQGNIYFGGNVQRWIFLKTCLGV